MECLFCKIAERQIPAEIVYRDDHATAFLDIRPLAPGHTVVVPNTHAETLLSLPDEEVAPLFLTVKRVTAMLNSALKPDGFTIGVNHGRASGQVVEHLHVHIIPRFLDDGGASLHSVVHNPPRESLRAIADKVRNIIAST